ncbi:hypothetical protein ACFQ5J_09745 [Lacticaseibacillus baoqingensis]|uniref:Lipoprotein n=1 Tax=Lacticaseibacillus baoqingensis TaxID=2486013 RepID=A0ABW4E6J3_9LACO|nr:hypothetical protein [Lacticaseibacillus baoqingensis]
MKTRIWVLPIVGLALFMAGCHNNDAKPAKQTSSPKTVVTSKQYTTAQLQKRYTTVVDIVVKPLTMASYSQPNSAVKKAAQDGVAEVEKVRLQLVANNSQPAQTKALIAQAQAAETMLKAMVSGTDQAAYNADAKTFMSQTNAIAKTYYNGVIPKSLGTYSQRMAAKQALSSSSQQ